MAQIRARPATITPATMGLRLLSMALLLAMAQTAAAKPSRVPVFQKIAGDLHQVVVVKGDTLNSIASANGVRVGNLVEDNDLAESAPLHPGRELTVDTRKIVPSTPSAQVVADICGGMLYMFAAGQMVLRTPSGFGSFRLQTPVGSFTLLSSAHFPYRPYPSSQTEEAENEEWVSDNHTPPELGSSLGPYWIQTSRLGFGIHPTPYTFTLGKHLGANQIRVGGGDAAKLHAEAKPGDRIETLYAPLRLAVTADGAIWAEAHPDPYRKGIPSVDDALEALGEASKNVDVDLLAEALLKALGKPVQIGTLPTDSALLSRYGGKDSPMAALTCANCPPGPDRRVTLRFEALRPVILENPFPLEVRDEAGYPVKRPEGEEEHPLPLLPGKSVNLIWECTDSEGRPLPPGSYTAFVHFTDLSGTRFMVSLPVWIIR